MPGDEADRAGTRSSDPDWWMRFLDRLGVGDRVGHLVVTTVEVGPLLGPQRFDDPQRLAEPPDPVVEAFDPVHGVLDSRPGGADAELEAAAGQVVDSDRELGQERGIAVGVAGDHAADSYALGGLRHRGLQRPTFVDRAVGTAGPDGR